MPRQPLEGISLSPGKQVISGDHAEVSVKNIGTFPEKVTEKTFLMHSHCAMASVTGVRVSPEGFTLAPGQARVVSVSVPPHTSLDYGILFRGIAVVHNADPIAPAIGAQVITGNALSCAHHAPPPGALLHPKAAGIPPALIVGLIVFCLAIVALALVRTVKLHRAR